MRDPLRGTTTGVTHRPISARAAARGNSEAVCPFSPTPRSTISKRALPGIKPLASVKALQSTAIVVSRCGGRTEFGIHGMDILRWRRNCVKHRVPYHPIIAFRVIGRDEALIAPKPMNALPGKSLPIRRPRQVFV